MDVHDTLSGTPDTTAAARGSASQTSAVERSRCLPEFSGRGQRVIAYGQHKEPSASSWVNRGDVDCPQSWPPFVHAYDKVARGECMVASPRAIPQNFGASEGVACVASTDESCTKLCSREREERGAEGSCESRQGQRVCQRLIMRMGWNLILAIYASCITANARSTHL